MARKAYRERPKWKTAAAWPTTATAPAATAQTARSEAASRPAENHVITSTANSPTASWVAISISASGVWAELGSGVVCTAVRKESPSKRSLT